MHKLLAEIEKAEVKRRTARGRSGKAQAFGSFLILVGVVLSTIGAT